LRPINLLVECPTLTQSIKKASLVATNEAFVFHLVIMAQAAAKVKGFVANRHNQKVLSLM
jgi:hypothetical protein